MRRPRRARRLTRFKATRAFILSAATLRTSRRFARADIPQLSGALFDLGASSMQMDSPERGVFVSVRVSAGHADGPRQSETDRRRAMDSLRRAGADGEDLPRIRRGAGGAAGRAGVGGKSSGGKLVARTRRIDSSREEDSVQAGDASRDPCFSRRCGLSSTTNWRVCAGRWSRFIGRFAKGGGWWWWRFTLWRIGLSSSSQTARRCRTLGGLLRGAFGWRGRCAVRTVRRFPRIRGRGARRCGRW